MENAHGKVKSYFAERENPPAGVLISGLIHFVVNNVSASNEDEKQRNYNKTITRYLTNYSHYYSRQILQNSDYNGLDLRDIDESLENFIISNKIDDRIEKKAVGIGKNKKTFIELTDEEYSKPRAKAKGTSVFELLKKAEKGERPDLCFFRVKPEKVQDLIGEGVSTDEKKKKKVEDELCFRFFNHIKDYAKTIKGCEYLVSWMEDVINLYYAKEKSNVVKDILHRYVINLFTFQWGYDEDNERFTLPLLESVKQGYKKLTIEEILEKTAKKFQIDFKQAIEIMDENLRSDGHKGLTDILGAIYHKTSNVKNIKKREGFNSEVMKQLGKAMSSYMEAIYSGKEGNYFLDPLKFNKGRRLVNFLSKKVVVEEQSKEEDVIIVLHEDTPGVGEKIKQSLSSARYISDAFKKSISRKRVIEVNIKDILTRYDKVQEEEKHLDDGINILITLLQFAGFVISVEGMYGRPPIIAVMGKERPAWDYIRSFMRLIRYPFQTIMKDNLKEMDSKSQKKESFIKNFLLSAYSRAKYVEVEIETGLDIDNTDIYIVVEESSNLIESSSFDSEKGYRTRLFRTYQLKVEKTEKKEKNKQNNLYEKVEESNFKNFKLAMRPVFSEVMISGNLDVKEIVRKIENRKDDSSKVKVIFLLSSEDPGLIANIKGIGAGGKIDSIEILRYDSLKTPIPSKKSSAQDGFLLYEEGIEHIESAAYSKKDDKRTRFMRFMIKPPLPDVTLSDDKKNTEEMVNISMTLFEPLTPERDQRSTALVKIAAIMWLVFESESWNFVYSSPKTISRRLPSLVIDAESGRTKITYKFDAFSTILELAHIYIKLYKQLN